MRRKHSAAQRMIIRSGLLRFANSRRRNNPSFFWDVVTIVAIGHEVIKRSSSGSVVARIKLHPGSQTALSMTKTPRSTARPDG
jgi:hypothetical protein